MEKAREQKCKEYFGSDFLGWRSKDKAFCTVIYFEDPDKLYFEFDEVRSKKRIRDKRSLNIEGVEPEEWLNKDYPRKAYYIWGKQLDRSFFSLEKEQQFEEIHQFFKRCIDAIDKACGAARK
ncbi:MAG: hypothetical protein ACOC7P_03660 [Chloroflexota bacterium]